MNLHEVLFADRLSMVRFLGGYNPAWTWGEARSSKAADLAYVGADGAGVMGYRWELIAPRLDPYLQAGYRDLILSLDNVPWDLAAKPSEGPYGQNAPPRDYDEWGNPVQAHRGSRFVSGQHGLRMGEEPPCRRAGA